MSATSKSATVSTGVERVTLSVPHNSLTAVVGPNGAGKPRWCRAFAGMIRPARGRILFDGADITGFDSSATCELGIGQVAEGRQIFPNLTVEENLQLAVRCVDPRQFLALNRERIFAMFPRC